MRALADYRYTESTTPSGAVIVSFANNPLALKAGDDGIPFDAAIKKASNSFNRHSADFTTRAHICIKSMELVLMGLSEVPERNRHRVLHESAQRYIGYIKDNANLFWYPMTEKFAQRFFDFIETTNDTCFQGTFLLQSYLGCLSLSLSKQIEDFRERPDLMAAYMNINQACSSLSHKQSGPH